MIKTLKNIRKLYNAKLLFVTNDNNLHNTIQNEFDEYFKELTLVSSSKEAVEKIDENSFDMIIIDTDVEAKNFEEACSEITTAAPSLPKIIISDSDKNDDIVTAINNSAYTFITKPLKSIDIKLAVIMCLNQTKRGDKIEFQHGIYFDEYRDQFFRPGGILIDFTRLEKGFMKLLISKKGEIIDYDTIKNVVWKGKNMSIYTMRNIVNKIRQKTYYEIIKNHSNKGYIIDEIQK
ncbi:response regulator transcription factor [Halarcobacter anaerophilus]|uniref:DNA-binding response regulator n=1 Tax=Halarcobacter anaerophilus TaxID=877500 RepID=A0A4Q0Y5E3_9BACT|nr:response regulator [Halarcobacter anaerophilus]QDF28922.1 two-component system response regulator, OmpR family [Halarcobacter anaerophilus]RXJ63561.1 DNA-binding response regulator [Halarcobacter anaerophilus]